MIVIANYIKANNNGSWSNCKCPQCGQTRHLIALDEQGGGCKCYTQKNDGKTVKKYP